MAKKTETVRFVPLEKQSKRAQRAFYSAQRKDWGGLNPVTRKPEKPNVYDRARSRRDWERPGGDFFALF